MIIVAAEVAQPDILQFGVVVGGQEFGSFAVAQVAGRTCYTLFQESGVGAELQHFLVIVRFDDEMGRQPHVMADRIRDMAHVGSEGELMIAILDIIADVVGAVVRNFKGGDQEIAPA